MSSNLKPALIPAPESYEQGEGIFHIQTTLRIGIPPSNSQRPGVAGLLADWLQRRTKNLRCEITDTEPDVQFQLESNDSPEAYRLEITPSGVLIAGSETGWVRGAAALTVLLGDEGWPVCKIQDAPRFRWRGMHLDVCRHFFPVRQVKRLIDLIALHRMNVFHWHLTDDQGWRLALDSIPQLAQISAWRDRDGERYGGYYTKEDVREILDYAEARKVLVVPEIEMPGHARAVLAAFPELSCAGGPFEVANTCGIFEDVYCAGKEKTFEFLEKVLAEVAQLFPGRFVHVGGDECPKTRWKECPDCQRRMKEQGLQNAEELQSWFITRAGKFLKALGKDIIGWDEILEGGIPPGAVVMSWRGVEGGVATAKMGHEAIMSPTGACYFDYKNSTEPEEPGNLGVIPLDAVYNYDPLTKDLDEDSKSKILGVQANIWTERIPTWKLLEYMILPRMCALSEVAWSQQEHKNWDCFQNRLEAHLIFIKQMGFTYRHPLRDHREFPL